jgi:hypothetical protein
MLMPLLPEQDSLQMQTERQLMYRNLIQGNTPTGEMIDFQKLPEFDFKQELANRWNFNQSDFSFSHGNLFGPGIGGISPSPFMHNATIFSEGSYQVAKNFRLGGYSFGGNSVFSAPFPNKRLNNFDTRGSTLFMQYNVSKNFKIETRVNVIQGPTP